MFQTSYDLTQVGADKTVIVEEHDDMSIPGLYCKLPPDKRPAMFSLKETLRQLGYKEEDE